MREDRGLLGSVVARVVLAVSLHGGLAFAEPAPAATPAYRAILAWEAGRSLADELAPGAADGAANAATASRYWRGRLGLTPLDRPAPTGDEAADLAALRRHVSEREVPRHEEDVRGKHGAAAAALFRASFDLGRLATEIREHAATPSEDRPVLIGRVRAALQGGDLAEDTLGQAFLTLSSVAEGDDPKGRVEALDKAVRDALRKREEDMAQPRFARFAPAIRSLAEEISSWAHLILKKGSEAERTKIVEAVGGTARRLGITLDLPTGLGEDPSAGTRWLLVGREPVATAIEASYGTQARILFDLVVERDILVQYYEPESEVTDGAVERLTEVANRSSLPKRVWQPLVEVVQSEEKRPAVLLASQKVEVALTEELRKLADRIPTGPPGELEEPIFVATAIEVQAFLFGGDLWRSVVLRADSNADEGERDKVARAVAANAAWLRVGLPAYPAVNGTPAEDLERAIAFTREGGARTLATKLQEAYGARTRAVFDLGQGFGLLSLLVRTRREEAKVEAARLQTEVAGAEVPPERWKPFLDAVRSGMPESRVGALLEAARKALLEELYGAAWALRPPADPLLVVPGWTPPR